MDIDYLLWLQGLREAAPAWVGRFFELVSAVEAGPLLLAVPFVLYWCFDKRRGAFVLFCFALGNLATQVVKNLVGCHRPWVRDARVRPAEGALDGATGYSFPSGHTTIAASTLGGIAWLWRRRGWVVAVCVVLTLLVGFSRNFLGVHTPQDVLAGLAVGAGVVAAVNLAARWVWAGEDGAAAETAAGAAGDPAGAAAEKPGGASRPGRRQATRPAPRPRRDLAVLLGGLGLCLAAGAVVLLAPHPLEYAADGALLVDPAEMRSDAFGALGYLSALLAGWFAERRLVRFSVGEGCGRHEKAARVALSLVLAAFCLLVAAPALKGALVGGAVGAGEYLYEYLKGFLPIVCCVLLGPALAKALFGARG